MADELYWYPEMSLEERQAFERQEEERGRIWAEEERRAAQAAQDFLSRHPHGCLTCWGTGSIMTPGVWRYPDGSGEPDSWDACGKCLEQGRCPLCGEQLPDDIFASDEPPACACGWKAEDA